MARRYILMGDVVRSRDYEARDLRRALMGLVSSCNDRLKDHILSPYTITLGDEFQGVARSLRSAIDSIFYFEETSFRRGIDFKIRYVVLYGKIDTPLNRLRAHSMMGEGLTRAREMLTEKRKGVPRFRFFVSDEPTMSQLNRLWFVIDGLVNRWQAADGSLILDMLANPNNDEVGRIYGKNRTQIWKRRKKLLVEEYRALKEAIETLAGKK